VTLLRGLALCAALGFATACAGGAADESARVENLLGGSSSYSLVGGHSFGGSVTALRVDSAKGATGDSGAGAIAGFPIISPAMPLTDADAAALGRILTDDATYDWGRTKGCRFRPEIVVRWTRLGSTVDALFCFTCDEVAFLNDGKYVDTEDFDARRADLVRIVKRTFPDDVEIQALRE
jgi:hypothetical protein